MKQQQCYIKKEKNPTKPKGKTNKRLKTSPISTISCITTTRKEVDASAILASEHRWPLINNTLSVMLAI